MRKPVLLEPIMTISVTVPDEHMGDVIGDLNSRRGKVLGAEPKGHGQQVIRAHVPMAEVLRYAPDLRSMTQRPRRLRARVLPLRGGPAAPRRAHRQGSAGGQGRAACLTRPRSRRRATPSCARSRRGRTASPSPPSCSSSRRASRREGHPAEPLRRDPRRWACTRRSSSALRGNKDARTILMRDPNRLIRRFVLQNPRIGDGEVIAVARNRSADEELLRMINEKREWVRNYQVRHALATNPKTPLQIALRHVATPRRARPALHRQVEERAADRGGAGPPHPPQHRQGRVRRLAVAAVVLAAAALAWRARRDAAALPRRGTRSASPTRSSPRRSSPT